MPQIFAQVSYFDVSQDEAGQRLDNWLLGRLKGAPRSLVYRIIRSGEVRVNKGRAKPAQRLAAGDAIRVPPVRLADAAAAPPLPAALLARIDQAVLYRDADLLVLNKPAGLAVHGGSGVAFGLIDVVRELWGEDWQLVHRLDRETSGCILLVRRRELQREFQERLAANEVGKHYLALVHGSWPENKDRVESRLKRSPSGQGERRVRSAEDGQRAVSHFRLCRRLAGASLMEVALETGRTHQIRVQSAELGHPLVGDAKYGRRALDAGLELVKAPGLCLHAARLVVSLDGRELAVQAPLPEAFEAIVNSLEPAA